MRRQTPREAAKIAQALITWDRLDPQFRALIAQFAAGVVAMAAIMNPTIEGTDVVD